MTTTHIGSPRQIDMAEDGNTVVPNAASWIGLAASPTCAVMALWTGFSTGLSDMLCINTAGGLSLNGMAAMCALMTTFHLRPWLLLASAVIHGGAVCR